MKADFKHVPVGDRLASIKESLSILQDYRDPNLSRTFQLDKASNLSSYSGSAGSLEDWEKNLLYIERQKVAELSAKLQQRERELEALAAEKHPRNFSSDKLAEKEHALSRLQTAYYELETKHHALSKKYKKLQHSYRKLSAGTQKDLATELITLREQNKTLTQDLHQLQSELKRRPPRKVLEDTKTKIKELENLIEVPGRTSPLAGTQEQSLVALLGLPSAASLQKTVKELLAKNAKYERFKTRLVALISQHNAELPEPSMKQLLRWIQRLFEEYVLLKKQSRTWKREVRVLYTVMTEVGVTSSGELLRAVRKLTKVVS